MSNVENVLEVINKNVVEDPEAFINVFEKRYANIISEIARKVSESAEKEIVMLAGPSASGKTTTANKLKEEFDKLGHEAFVISLDDFYGDKRFAPKFPDGTPNYETVYALDIPLIGSTLNQLLESGRCEVPIFDFSLGKRLEKKREICLDDGDVLIVEGLHALNPLINDMLPSDNVVKLYVSVSSRIYDEKGNIVLNKRNLRFIRRMIRDYKFRNSDVENTYMLWQGVQVGEEEYLFPYKDLADYKINSIHSYEPCVFKSIGIKMLEQVDNNHENYKDARRLIKSLERFEAIPMQKVPEDSLLREFLGK